MSKIIDFNKFKEDNGPCLEYSDVVRKMKYKDMIDAIVAYNQRRNLEVRKAMALFSVANERTTRTDLKEILSMMTNHLKQELKVLKKTYR